jgi:hypothetical protein
MTIVEAARGITGGVDTHRDVHVAAALDPLGGLLGSESFATAPAGYKVLLSWLESFGDVTKIGVEGKHGLLWFGTLALPTPGGSDRHRSRPAQSRGAPPQRQVRPSRRRRSGRAALSGRAIGHPKSRDGAVEAIRVLMVAKRSARQPG